MFIENVHCFDELEMPEFVESLPKDYDIGNNPMFKDIPFVKADNRDIDILVGSDVPILHQVMEDRSDPKIDTVHACRSPIGWYVAGLCKSVIMAKTEGDVVSYALSLIKEEPDVLERHLNNPEKYDFNDPVYNKIRG